jgi:MAE_28990/MAE_18760-like HEPN
MQRCRHSELSDPMIAIVLRSKLLAAEGSKKIGAHIEIVEFFRGRIEQRAVLPYKAVLRTEANLSSTVLFEIIRTIGLNSTGYEPKRHLIDHRLLAKRNHIAHGSTVDVDLDDYLCLHDEVLELMDLFRNDVENAAATRQYLSRKPAISI